MKRIADPPGSSGPRASIGTIEQLWRQAFAREFHGQFCKCFSTAVKLDAASLEADILDYLLPRYSGEQLGPLVDLLKRRQAEPVGSFVDWLRNLASTIVIPGLYTRLIRDVDSILSSIGIGSPGFACK
jgi:hypothetical protein